MEQHNKPVCELLCIDFCNKYEEQKSTIRELEARIAALTKDAERLKCFNQIWRWKALKDGEIIYQYGEHVPALFQKTAELLPTHQPAPDYTDLLKMIAHRARSFPNFPLGHHITEVFAAIGEEPPEPAPAPKAITADMVTDEMVKTSVFVNVFNAKQQIANVVNAFNGVNP